jgi:hypothetical protein
MYSIRITVTTTKTGAQALSTSCMFTDRAECLTTATAAVQTMLDRWRLEIASASRVNLDESTISIHISITRSEDSDE